MQKEIQLTDKTLLVVGLPKVLYVELEKTNNTKLLGLKENRQCYFCEELPKGDWQLLGIYPELTEEQAKMVVESHEIPFLEHTFCYPDYSVYGKTGFKAFDTALESFQSLMERENITGFEKYAILINSK